ncbi:hypothetical protein LX16_2213 [Stackebrandtia albiflava]|uniref:HAD superfamily hydrolase (TIGR01484 family) n=1 Tax=Stackebrandtia albiflava TaxID=406432 RepID=A0A562V0T9_9ACTN|nr:HAD family hydrolase [Stackebrandtia albiflava]TWJ11491.1 hypothetical protein LX16_2213 [Stackebrandtia albiflava]
MSPLPRLVATDLDGTLVRTDNTVSERSHRTLARLVERGVHVVGITGRGPRLLRLCRDDIPSAGHLVLAQGGYVYHCDGPDSAVPLRETVMPGDRAAAVVELLERHGGDLTVIAECDPGHEAPLIGAVIPDWPWPVPILGCEREDIFRGPVIKTFVRSMTVPALELLEIARSVVPADLASVTEAGIGFVEICPPGTTKATGLAYVADRLGVDSRDVMVFGDALNDLPMFEWAGRAVAMTGAHPDVKAAADEVTGSNDEDGVATYLERLLATA